MLFVIPLTELGLNITQRKVGKHMEWAITINDEGIHPAIESLEHVLTRLRKIEEVIQPEVN